jgi:hypothetical protein
MLKRAWQAYKRLAHFIGNFPGAPAFDFVICRVGLTFRYSRAIVLGPTSYQATSHRMAGPS